MKRTTFLTLVFLAAAAALTFGQVLTVDYLDGSVDLKTAKGWKVLSIGDQIPADASIRISQGGSVELTRGKQRISLVKDGVYAVADLSRTAEKAGSTGLGASFGQKLKTLTTAKAQTTSTVAGARGAAQGETEGLLWVDESDDVRKKVSDLLEKGQYAEAAPIARTALAEASSEAEKKELSYLLASACYGAGETARAYRAVANVLPDASDPYYADFAILKAQILLSTGYFADSLSLLKPLIASKPQVPYAQAAYLLSAQASRSLGDEASARASLKTGYDLDPASDTAKLISDSMK